MRPAEIWHRRIWRSAMLLVTFQIVVFIGYTYSQTTSTGALTGLALDPTGALLPGVVVSLINQDSSTARSVS